MARLSLGQRDGAAAEQHLRAILSGGKDGYEIRLLLARSALGREDSAGAQRELEAASRIDPERLEAWQGLSELGAQGNDATLRFRALGRIARIDEHDREANALMLAHLVETEAWDEALEIGEMAPFVDPHNAQSHRLLAQVYLHHGRHDDALYEADSALVGGHETPAEVQIVRARALKALGRARLAREAVEAAIAADPSVAERARAALN